MYYLTIIPEIKEKVRKELRDLKANSTSKGTDDWINVLTYENLSDLKYMTMVINETMRRSPAVEFSTLYTLTETLEINGITIMKHT